MGATLTTPTAVKPKIISGRIPYGAWSTDIPTKDGRSFREQLAPGCFSDSLRAITRGDETCLFRVNHGWTGDGDDYGSTADGALSLQDTPEALLFSLSIDPDDERGMELYQRARSPMSAINGVSFAFTCEEDRWSDDGKFRSIYRARLSDVSLVDGPAYPQASYELRRRLARLFHASDVDALASEANDVERRLVECFALPAELRAGVAQRTRQEFLQHVAYRGRLNQFELIELRKELDEIGPTPKR